MEEKGHLGYNKSNFSVSLIDNRINMETDEGICTASEQSLVVVSQTDDEGCSEDENTLQKDNIPGK